MAAAGSKQPPILVAGGGIGGLSAALALARRGFRVRVLEQARQFREVGAGIQLGPNVFRALAALGLRERVLADAWRPEAQEMRCGLTGRQITRVPLGPEFLARFGEPYGVTHRADLHGAILAACTADERIALETGRSVTAVVQDAGGVRVRLSDGGVAEGAALIGCDGLWSTLREAIVGDGAPRVSGHIAYRAVLARALITAGADLTLTDDRYRSTPLGWAEALGQDEIASMLRASTA